MQLHKKAGGGEIFWTRLGDFSDCRSSLWSTARKGRGLNGERMGDVSERFWKGEGRKWMLKPVRDQQSVSLRAKREQPRLLPSQ